MHVFVSTRGSLCRISDGTRLCTNCARIQRFHTARDSFERWPPPRGGCMSLKLSLELVGHGVAQLESGAQHGSAAKAVFFMERSCPMSSMAPVLAIV